MRLILTRHGETEENKQGVLQGHLPGTLSPLGLEQAKKLARRLKDEPIDFIFSSDLDRTVHTTKEITKFHSKVPIEFTPDLRERHMGQWHGKKKTELEAEHQNTRFIELNPPGGETLPDLYYRAEKFLHKIIESHHRDNVLVIAHDGFNRALITVITGQKPEDIRILRGQQNTSVNIFEIDENRNHKIVCFNCTKHLRKE